MGRMPDAERSTGLGRQTQSAIYRAGASGREPRIPVRWPELVAGVGDEVVPLVSA